MRYPLSLLVIISIFGLSPSASAHCQVPCGIYDDHARIHAMLEDTETITKAKKKLIAMEGKTDAKSFNQKVRWTTTKEGHASNIIDVVSTYFLTQKIAPANPKDKAAYKAYIEKLTACHQVLRHAMKAKQTVDLSSSKALKAAIEHLGTFYTAK